jgi:hypothetical protein
MLGLLLLVILVVLPALIGTLVGRGYLSFGGHIFRGKFHAGVPIVYRVVETSTCPGPEARDIHPAERGELYYYLTHKYWRVEEVRQDGWIVALTPLMEHHYLRRDDPNLRKANLLERLRYAARFPYLA